MPKRTIAIVYDVQFIVTPQGIANMTKGFAGEIIDDIHYEQIMTAWNSNPRQSIEIPANKDELKEGAKQGIVASTTLCDLSRALWITIREETELDLATASDIININSKNNIKS